VLITTDKNSTICNVLYFWKLGIDLSRFYDRQKELQIPESLIIEDPYRLIGIFGVGGIGKAFGCLTFIIVVGSDRDK